VENLHLIVGLGNPGQEYSGTRHNVGFLVAERVAQAWHGAWRNEKRFFARLARVERHGRKALLCEPQTFMNSSGDAVAAVVRYYDVALERLLVVVDDADLPLGELRMRPSGGTGGHHGLESIESQLGGRNYARLRVGIGRRDGQREITGHVLGRFGSTETGLLDKVLAAAAGQVDAWLESGIQKAMNEFNGIVEDSENERAKQ
jgi:PTH1 family peptidyl-tRNA hydrolase